MEHGDIKRLSAAAGSGELLVVIYAGGCAPGHKRRIVVRTVDIEADEMSVFEQGQLRTYLISKTTLVDESDPAPWMPDDAGKAVVVDPEVYFAGWAFTIRTELRAALGVFTREVVDKEKSALARQKAIARGMPKATATRRFRITRLEVVVNVPPVYRFEAGDLFYRGEHGGADWAQVIAVRTVDGVGQVDVYRPGGNDFRVPAARFADFLKTGRPIDRAFALPAHSFAE